LAPGGARYGGGWTFEADDGSAASDSEREKDEGEGLRMAELRVSSDFVFFLAQLPGLRCDLHHTLIISVSARVHKWTLSERSGGVDSAALLRCISLAQKASASSAPQGIDLKIAYRRANGPGVRVREATRLPMEFKHGDIQSGRIGCRNRGGIRLV
jgi:hypothetical protein